MKLPKAMPAKALRETSDSVPQAIENAAIENAAIENAAIENPAQDAIVKLDNCQVRLPNLPPIVSFDSLTSNGQEIWIENCGQMYRLRRTRQGKLILTK